MIERAYIWIDGPPQSGKTTLVERLLTSWRNELVLAARIVPARTKKQVGPAKSTPETKRYAEAGAIGSMLFRYAPGDPDAFWGTDLVENYSRAIVFEGEPGDFVSPDLMVYVTRPLAEGQDLLVKGPPGMRQADRENMAYMERVLFRGDPGRISALHELQRLLPGLGLKPAGSGWTISADHSRITGAAVVIINIHDESERPAAERLAAEVRRLRDDPEVKRDVLGIDAQRRQPAIFVANLADPKDKVLKKALARVKRLISRNDGGFA